MFTFFSQNRWQMAGKKGYGTCLENVYFVINGLLAFEIYIMFLILGLK